VISEIHEIAEQRQHADDDDDDAHDLLSAAINRQHIDQIKDEKNNDERNECSDEDVHANPRFEFLGLFVRMRRELSTMARARLHPEAASNGILVYSGDAGRETAMSDSPSLIMIQFLSWVADRPRTYAQAMDAWRTSCPRLSVWEDAVIEDLVRIDGNGARAVALTKRGAAVLQKAQNGQRRKTSAKMGAKMAVKTGAKARVGAP
jgi:hypothetical protein